jgi:hypothetical protein
MVEGSADAPLKLPSWERLWGGYVGVGAGGYAGAGGRPRAVIQRRGVESRNACGKRAARRAVLRAVTRP